jgi:exportin-2 (importin alpha re-exporter)
VYLLRYRPLTRHGGTQLVAKATAFLGTVVKMPSQKPLFESQQTLEAFCEKIVLPNMTLRTFEEELFEDDPAEYVRRDLDTAGERMMTCMSA